MKRTFNAGEIAKILRSHGVPEFELADGLKAVQMATAGGLVWTIEVGTVRDGADIFLRDADPAMLNRISEILWTKVSPQFLDSREILDDKLTPDVLLDNEREDVLDPMTPDALKDEVDPLEGTIEGMTPDALREKKGPAKPSLEDELTPDALRDEK